MKKAPDFVHILSCDHILTYLMLSGIVSTFDSFYNSRRICLISKILATIVNAIYIPVTGLSKFLGLLLCTASAPVYPQIESQNRGLCIFLIPHIHILQRDAEVSRLAKLDHTLQIINLLPGNTHQVIVNRSLYFHS